jgi:hypothetical protein
MKDDTELKRDCDVLKRIAGRYPDESVEMRTLTKAAFALHLVFLKDFGSERNHCLEKNDKPLTKEQTDHLKRMGLQ